MSDRTVHQFQTNVRANVLRFALTGPVMLWMVHEVHRHLPPRDYGLWALASLPATQYLVLDAGGFLGLTRLIGRVRGEGRPEDAGPLVGGLYLAYAGLVALAGLAGALAATLQPERFPAALVGLALVGYAIGLAGVPLQALIAGHERVDLQNLAVAAGTVLSAVACVLAAPSGVPALLAAQAAATALLTVGLWVTAVHVAGRPPLALPSRERARALARECATAFTVQLYGLAYMHGDKLALGGLVGLEAVGAYDIGARLLHYLRLLGAKIVDPILPAAARLSANPEAGRPELLALLTSALARTAWLWAGAATGLALFAEPVLALWLSRVEPGPVVVLRALALAYGVHSLGIVLWYYWAGCGEAGLNLRYVSAGALLWAAGSLAGARAGGLEGLLVGFLVSATLVTAWFARASFARLPAEVARGLAGDVARACAGAAVAAGAGLALQVAAGPVAGLVAHGLTFALAYYFLEGRSPRAR